MIALADFKREIKEKPLAELADRLLLADGAKFVSEEEIKIISDSIIRAYGLDSGDLKIIITGSAKLGFSIIEKIEKDGSVKPRFRPYTGLSDVDVAVVSKVLFERLWRELSYFASNSSFFPLNYKKLGPYLVSGWLRPDHFPVSPLLPDCKKWSPIFWDLSRHPKLGRRQIRGGPPSIERPGQPRSKGGYNWWFDTRLGAGAIEESIDPIGTNLTLELTCPA